MTDGDGEEAGEAESFVVAGRFQIAPQWLRAHVDTKYGLGLGPNLDLAWHVAACAGRIGRTPAGWSCIEAADLESEFLKQLFQVGGFEGLEPYRAMCRTAGNSSIQSSSVRRVLSRVSVSSVGSNSRARARRTSRQAAMRSLERFALPVVDFSSDGLPLF